MGKSVISEGKTTSEAIENGLKKLGVSKDKVDVKVLESSEKKSFFSILAPRVVKVELILKENIDIEKKAEIKKEYKVVSKEDLDIAEKNIKEFLENFIKTLNGNAEYEIIKEDEGLNISLKGKDVGFLIGYRGETLYSFQNIIKAIANKDVQTKMRIILDIEGYKEKREKTLEELAEKIAKTVERTGKSITLEPMQAYERKIIHSKLQNSNKVATKSIGEEPRRKVVVYIK